MSTKTTIKRIALVAVAALGFGLLSVVPSQAALITDTVSIDSTTDTVAVSESATSVITQTMLGSSSTDSVTIQAAIISKPAGAPTTNLRLLVSDSSTATGGQPTINYGESVTNSISNRDIAATNPDSRTVASTANVAATVKYTLVLYNAPVSGEYQVKVYLLEHAAGAASGTVATSQVTWTVTVSATDTVATAASTGTLRQGSFAAGTAAPWSGTREGTDSTVVVAKSATSSTPEATILFVLKNATSTASESITVSASGPAYLSSTATRPANGVSALTLAYSNTTSTPVYIWSTGTAGTATITASTAGGVSLGTHTVKFFGNVTKLAISSAIRPNTIGRAGGYANSSMFYVYATDALGIPVTGLTFATGLTSDSTVAAAPTVAEYKSGLYAVSFSSATGSVSGKKATLTMRVVDPAVTTSTSYITVTQDVTLGGSVAKEVITLDKSSYESGDGMIVTITATDASGNPVYDGAASPELTSSKALGGSATFAASTYFGGKVDSQSRDADGTILNPITLYAPASGGTFSLNGTSGNDTGDAISVTATVTDNATAATDAANEATDAANAATDAANAAAEAADAATAAAQDAQAAVAALATQVTSLIAGIKAQITSLTNLVIKIQKKVKA